MKEISPKALDKNTFSIIGDDWMLITASNGEKVNTMTASWGGLGVFCNKEVAFTFIRPQRYTKEFVDCADTFSLSVLGEKYRDALTYLGRISGRDEDKISTSGLTVATDGNTPYFEESEIVIICRKMCEVELEEGSFFDSEYCDKFFRGKDFHTLYISEIVKVMAK